MNDAQRKKVDQLIQDFEDGVLSESGHAELMQLMREHPEAVELYVSHMKLVALLKHTASNRVKLGEMPENPASFANERTKKVLITMAFGMAAVVLVGLFLVFFTQPLCTYPGLSQS